MMNFAESHSRCMESLQRDCWEALAETSVGDAAETSSGGGSTAASSGGGVGMRIYSLEHFGAGGQVPKQEGLAAWWQQTAGVRALVRGGIPPEDRGRLWFELSGAARKMEAHSSGYYSSLAETATPAEGASREGATIMKEVCIQNETIVYQNHTKTRNVVFKMMKFSFSGMEKANLKRLKQIEKDIARTFAGEKTRISNVRHKRDLSIAGMYIQLTSVFVPGRKDPGRASLRRVLFAYASHNPDVGYCQAMNLILAHLLLQLGVNEERGFWLLATMIEDIVPGFHTPAMEGLQTQLQVLNELLAEGMPAIKTSLNRNAVPLDLITMELLIGAFCTTLPRHTLYRLWDVLFFEGSAVLLAAVMEIFEQSRAVIEAAESMEVVLSAFGVAGRGAFDASRFIGRLGGRLDTWPQGRLLEKQQRYTLGPAPAVAEKEARPLRSDE